MPFRVTFDLDDKDLRYFRSNMKQAMEAASQVSEAEVLESAVAMVEQIRKAAKVPMFVAIRVAKLKALIDMVRDEDWNLADKERRNVISALAYFTDPEDMIPDSIPVLGFIDDAIMIELVTRELAHEIDAYNDFCRYRDDPRTRKASGGSVSREDFLESKRKELHGRMRRRRARTSQAPSGRTRVTLF
jgi:uncharacterized membrane protein YkvA (DUF1232 family)